MGAATLLVPEAVALPEGVREGLAVLMDGPLIAAVDRTDRLAGRADAIERLEGLTLGPGLVDLQVNGGGGVLLNDQPTLEGVEAIAAAHRRCGTTSLLPTLITAPLATMEAALEAVRQALDAAVPGVVGLHLEGPFLDAERRGAHEAHLIRSPTADDLALLQAPFPGRLLMTLAASAATEQVTVPLRLAGVLLSLGHTEARAEEARRAFDRGVSLVTHLYNAMSPLAHRAPGTVGAALADDRVTACVIADGHHVHPIALRAAWEAKGPARFACVSDAIGVAGTDLTEATLAGQRVIVEGGRCLNEEGNLAGSAIVLADSLPVLVRSVGLSLAEALVACATTPAAALGLHDRGRVAAHLRADLVALDADLAVQRTWVGGAAVG